MSVKNTIVALVVAATCSTGAYAFTIDGNLADWGITVADNNGSALAFNPGINLLAFDIEDQDDNADDGGFLGPNLGGQNYDAELLGVSFENSRFFVAIVSGQRPDNGFERFGPGDIRIETSGGTYGIEVGGGIGGGDGAAISAGEAGSTYTLNNNGYTTAYATADAQQTAGSIWSEVDWLLDPIAPFGPTQFEVNQQSTLVGMADYVFTRNETTAQHSIIELSFDVSIFGGETIESIEWRPSCGNDELSATVNAVPEPASLVLMACGGWTLVRRCGRKSKVRR